MPEFCQHGLVQLRKYGVDADGSGLEICRQCHLPTYDSYVKAGKPFIAAAPPTRVLIVTTNDVPGYSIEEVHGDVFGLVVRARNVFANWGASVRTIAGGEVAGYTKLLTDSRREARERLMSEARELGANAVVAMRFDCNEIGDIMSEIAAYGTAVTIRPVHAEGRPPVAAPTAETP